MMILRDVQRIRLNSPGRYGPSLGVGSELGRHDLLNDDTKRETEEALLAYLDVHVSRNKRDNEEPLAQERWCESV